MAIAAYNGAVGVDDSDRRIHIAIDSAREAMSADMRDVEERCRTYLRWYSPAYRSSLATHDAWKDSPRQDELGLTRNNFPLARAVVDIWTSLEAAKPAILRAQPERLMPPVPSLDEGEALRTTLAYGALRKVEQIKASIRSQTIQRWLRRDQFALTNHSATRRKNLYGFSWVKVWPNLAEKRPQSHAVRNVTSVYPIWSSREPGETEGVLFAFLRSAQVANRQYDLGLEIDLKSGKVSSGYGDSGEYREVNDRYVDSTRTMVWVEEYWWREQELDRDGTVTSSVVYCVTRVAGKIVKRATYPKWRYVPFVYYENTDERDSYGWSDIASVIDINDEFNRRLSQEGDIIGMYSAPRFQLLQSFSGRAIEMPRPFELIALQDQERIEQIITRIDTFPTQQHFQILTDLLHRVSGLPPITWGLIANAQTSGRALTASWKATEARLAPKLMRNEATLDSWLDRILNYADVYDWKGSRRIFTDRDDEPFRDFEWDFPPMEPRDFQEVTQNEITKRDAGLQSTLGAMRETGDEAAEDTLEEVLAEALNVLMHPDKVQSYYLAKRAELDNISYAQQLGQSPGSVTNTATVAQAAGAARQGAAAVAAQGQPTAPEGTAIPPTQAGAPGNAAVTAPPPPGGNVTTGTLQRNGEVSNQYLQTGQL